MSAYRSGALFAEENTTVNLTALAPDDTGKVAEMSVSIGTLYVEGKTTLNLSGMPEGSVVIDRVVMPANSLLTITRNGGAKVTIHELYTTQSSLIIGMDHAVLTNGVTVYESDRGGDGGKALEPLRGDGHIHQR